MLCITDTDVLVDLVVAWGNGWFVCHLMLLRIPM